MTTVQIIGVSVAGAAVLLLIVALIVTRRKADDGREDEVATGASFLDGTPQDTLAGLGREERPVEDQTLDPAAEEAAAEPSEEAAARVRGEATSQPGGLGLDWGPDLSVRESVAEAPAPSRGGEDRSEATQGPPHDDQEITGELRPGGSVAPPAEEAPHTPEGESGDQATASEPARPVEGGPAAGTPAAKESGSRSRLVPLSDIIVTTSGKMVDLADPEVRRMLTELVTFEIDQAADFRRQGQTIDAVLQLTEAEKVAHALGMTETAQRIRAMMEDIRREE